MGAAEVIRAANAQWGCIRWDQALKLSSKRQFRTLIAQGIFKKIHPATYVLTSDSLGWKQRACAVALSIPGSAISHTSAARLLGLTFAETTRLEVTAPGTGEYKRTMVEVHNSLQLSSHTTLIDNIPVTDASRTIVDVSEYNTWKQMGAILDQARMLKLATPAQVNACLDRMDTKGRPRITGLRRALESRLDSDKDIDTFLEKRTLDWIRGNGFPEPETQIWYRGGSRPYRMDIWYAGFRLNIEPDGPHHLLPHFALEDKKRDAELAARNIAVFRVPLDMEEHEFVRLFADLIRSRSSRSCSAPS